MRAAVLMLVRVIVVGAAALVAETGFAGVPESVFSQVHFLAAHNGEWGFRVAAVLLGAVLILLAVGPRRTGEWRRKLTGGDDAPKGPRSVEEPVTASDPPIATGDKPAEVFPGAKHPVSMMPKRPGDARVNAQATAQKARDARRAELEQAIKHGKYLAGRCRQAQTQLSFNAVPFFADTMVAELAVIVEDWKAETGGYVVPEPKGNWRMDLARLTLYVEKHVAALEARLNLTKADKPAA